MGGLENSGNALRGTARHTNALNRYGFDENAKRELSLVLRTR